MRKLLTFGLTLLVFIIPVALSRADELDDVTKKLNEQKRDLSDLEKRKDQLAQEIASASVSLAQVSAELDEAEADLGKIQRELSEREKTLKQWETTRNVLIRQFYKQSRISPFEIIFSAEDFIGSTRQLQYHQENLNLLRENILALSGEIVTFKENKEKAEKLKNELAALRDQYQASLSYSQSAYYSTGTQLSQVKSSIKNLTARQEQLILEKFAATAQSETVGDKEPLSEPLPEPGFGSRPAYMVATYGYPHRIGMSQYGAYGRSKKGRNYKEILRAYYKINNTNIRDFRPKSKIYVKGCSYGPPPWVSGGWSKSTCQNRGYTWYDGWVNFETYIGRLYEVPSSWGSSANKGMNALKAQAVAARSYAWAYTNNGAGPICPSTYCQYYKGSDKGGYWEQAVNATRDEVIVVGGSPLKAFYHSTAGGYTISSRNWISYDSWDNGIKDFHPDGKAYEVISGAPWYHTGWGSRTGGGYNPWMTKKEFTDIFNVLLLCTTKGQTIANCSYIEYLSPIDKDGWDISRVRQKLVDLGITPVTGISAVVTTFDGKANTASVYIKPTNRSALTFKGSTFRSMFNLRSRGTLAIWTYYFDVGVCTKSSGCASSVQFK